MSMKHRHAHFLLGILLAAACAASAQPAAEKTAPGKPPPDRPAGDMTPGAQRLRDFEATYQQGLRKIQAPLLAGYFSELQQLLASSPAADQAAIQAEIARIQKLITDGGVIDLAAAAAPQPEPPKSMPAPRNPPGTVLVLKPSAARVTPLSGLLPGAIALGAAEWPVEHLDEGSYDVVALYSLPAFTGAASIITSVGGKRNELALTPDKAMPVPDQFRILRLAHFDFDHDVNNDTLKIELKSADLRSMPVRQVFVVKPKARNE